MIGVGLLFSGTARTCDFLSGFLLKQTKVVQKRQTARFLQGAQFKAKETWNPPHSLAVTDSHAAAAPHASDDVQARKAHYSVVPR